MTPAERAAMKAAVGALRAHRPLNNSIGQAIIDDAIAALRSCLSSAGQTVSMPREFVEGLIVTLRSCSNQPVEAKRLEEMLK